MMEYTVCVLICRETNRFLLSKKDRTDFAGRFNGVGGKIEPGETPAAGAIREIKEETGADVTGRLCKLGTLQLPLDCGKHDPQGCVLHFYTADVSEEEISQQPGETEQLTWFPAKSVVAIPAASETFAGDGDLQYFANLALKRVYYSPEATMIVDGEVGSEPAPKARGSRSNGGGRKQQK